MNETGPLAQALQLSRNGKHAEAEKVCKQILATNQTDPRVWCHLGTCYLSMNRFEEAIKAYDQAVKRHPRFAEAINNMGVAYARLKKVDQAVQYFNQARATRPNWAEPSISLGNLYVSNERFDEAMETFAQAARAEPMNPEPQLLVATILARMGRLDIARQHFIESLRLNPRNAVAHSNLLLALNYDPDIDPAILLNEHVWFDRLQGQGMSPIAPHVNPRSPDRPLRIGYVSPDLRRHAVAWFMLPVFEAHDPKNFLLFAYASQTDNDAITDRMRSKCAGWRSVIAMNDAQVVEQIRGDGIDILVDLAGHTSGNRLGVFTRRPAPVQVTYLGYPNTTGLSGIGYCITDSVVDPVGSGKSFVEKLIRLPGCFCCFAPPDDLPEVAPPPCVANGYITFGLLHKLAKYNPGMLDLWSRVMREVPGSRAIIFRDSLDQSAQQELARQFAQREIDSSRLEFIKQTAREGAHYASYAKFDISLDSLPWSGHTTSCESMWMGVPMITLRGNRHAGRMAASILQTVGVPELIAENPEQYLSIARELAGDVDRLKKYRGELREKVKQSPLGDSAKFTRGLESAYRQMWHRWCKDV